MTFLIGIFLGTFIGFFIASLCRVSADGPMMPAAHDETRISTQSDQASELRRQMLGQQRRWR